MTAARTRAAREENVQILFGKIFGRRGKTFDSPLSIAYKN